MTLINAKTCKKIRSFNAIWRKLDLRFRIIMMVGWFVLAECVLFSFSCLIGSTRFRRCFLCEMFARSGSLESALPIQFGISGFIQNLYRIFWDLWPEGCLLLFNIISIFFSAFFVIPSISIESLKYIRTQLPLQLSFFPNLLSLFRYNWLLPVV